MVLAQCPVCDQDVPSKADVCPHCGLNLNEVDEARIIEQRRRRLRDRIYHARMVSYLALASLIAAFGWVVIASNSLTRLPPNGPYILFSVGAVVYLIMRVLLFKYKLTLRKLLRR